MGLAHVGHAWQLVLLFTIMGLVGMSGPGALATSVPVLKWFVRNRGRALAFMSLGVPIGAMVFVPLTKYLIDTVGWEMAWIIIAVIGTGVIVPLAAIFVIRKLQFMDDPSSDISHPLGTMRMRPMVCNSTK